MTVPPKLEPTQDFSDDDEVTSVDDEVANIDDAVQQIYAHIHQLHEECASLLRRRNELRSSTGTLPPEILSLIFRYACPPANFWDVPYDRIASQIKKPVFHLILASVSSHWRNVALSTPQIWSSASRKESWYYFKFKRFTGYEIQKWEEFYRVLFDRSNGMPIEMAFHDVQMLPHREWPYFFSPKIDAMFLENQHCIQSIRLEIKDVDDKWMSLLSKFTQLTTLSITPQSDESCLHERTFSIPTNLTISRFRLRGPFKEIHLDTPWITVTVLDLSSIGIDVCMKLLVGCPNLIEFRSSDPDSPNNPHDGSILTELQELANLETLQWCFLRRSAPWVNDLFKYIRAPNLKFLRWDETGGIPGNSSNAPGFLNDLPITLKTLEFVQVNYRSCLFENNLLQCIHPELQVENVVLELCNKDFIKTILRMLVISPDEGTVVFPGLKNIRIKWFCEEYEGDPSSLDLETGELLVGVLQSRWIGGYIDRFTFMVEDVQILHWEPFVIDDLNQLFEDGLDLVAVHAIVHPSFARTPVSLVTGRDNQPEQGVC